MLTTKFSLLCRSAIAVLAFTVAAYSEISTNAALPESVPDSVILKVIFPVTLTVTQLPEELMAMFEKEYGIPCKKVSLCAGDAVEYLKNPKSEVVDVVITHEMDIAKKLVADSVCVNLRELHYSNCVLVGPKQDPAGVKGMQSPTEALKIIAKKQHLFFSRGDNSGTHGVEKKMWRLSNIQPNGDWYISTFAGTDATLIIASRKRGYTIVHYPSFLQMQETLDMEVMVDGNYDNRMITDYQVTVTNPQRFPDALYVAGIKFIGYLTSPEIQSYIAHHSIDLFKCQTNFPLAVSVQVDGKNN